ncbi:DUF7344 domain-containing protein [Haloprofundus halobius]|uniref:DUF7344 domain-containing protein n=1 Tax=Haloprofundus halobius TaxID=2876194 RepID=UPI001CCF8AD5|nr:hypothetical protein [Haloprofundus halobius]
MSSQFQNHSNWPQILSALSDQQCRRLLGYLHEKDGDIVSLGELTEYLAGGEADSIEEFGTDNVAISLHHIHLPKLANIGLVEYDTRNRTVRYRGHEEVERAFDCLAHEEWVR